MKPSKPKPKPGKPSHSFEEDPPVYPLPADTRAILQGQAKQCLNAGLQMERYLLCNSQNWELTQETKRRQNAPPSFTQGDLPRLISAHRQRWEALLKGWKDRGYAVRQSLLKPSSRLAVGLGAASVLETNLTLHRLYGFPILPGSALKGLARSYAELVAGCREGDEEFDAVFGTQQKGRERAGGVIFFDAIPSNPKSLRLQLDVMNPHYGDYYMQKAGPSGQSVPPADYLNPVPVYFLTIAPGSEFLFAVASREPALAERAEAWLQGGLKELGVGAKTVAGYGYF